MAKKKQQGEKYVFQNVGGLKREQRKNHLRPNTAWGRASDPARRRAGAHAEHPFELAYRAQRMEIEE